MGENETSHKFPVSIVRFGIGKELRLYEDEIAVTSPEEGHEIRVPLNEIKLLTLMPGDPNPSKLVLIADMTDDTSIILAEGMSNAKDFRAMLPILQELNPDIELDPPDMSEQLRQALNNRRAWTLTCYGAILLICLSLYILYLIVAYIGTHH
jgi:hypothetical protein